MKLKIDKEYNYNPKALLRKCGYHEITNQEGEKSYVRAFGPSGYPRFHVYVKEGEKHLSFNLHLDQKKPTYGKQKTHSGEYEGKVVDVEYFRIKSVVKKAFIDL